MLEEVAHFFCDHAVKPVLGFVELRQDESQRLFGQLHFPHELPDVFRAFADFLVTSFDEPFDDVGQEALETLALVLLLFRLVAIRGRELAHHAAWVTVAHRVSQLAST
ncbi:hypothetical protein D3C83_56630 [compost metagenome]